MTVPQCMTIPICTTHHKACDCREAMFAEIVETLKLALEGVEMPTGIGIGIGGLGFRYPQWVPAAQALIARATESDREVRHLYWPIPGWNNPRLSKAYDLLLLVLKERRAAENSPLLAEIEALDDAEFDDRLDLSATDQGEMK